MEERAGCFGLKGLHQPEDWDRIAKLCVNDCLQIAQKIRSHRHHASVAVLQNFDDLSDRLCSVLDVAELCRNVHPDPDFVQAANSAFLHVSDVIQHLNADRSLYEPLDNLHYEYLGRGKRRSMGTLSDEDAVMVTSLKHDFERGGINLGQREKERLIALQNETTSASSEFVSKPVELPATLVLPAQKLSQLPLHFRNSLARSRTNSNNLVVPMNNSSMQLMLKWIPDGNIREKVYRVTHEAQSQEKLGALDSILRTRHKTARTLGHDSYAKLLFSDRVASSPNEVQEFIGDLSRLIQGNAHDERNSLEVEKLRLEPHMSVEKGSVPVHGWDRSFYIGRLKAQDFNLSSVEVSNYLSLSSCLRGLASILEHTFGVEMNRVEAHDGELWHESVQKLELIDESGDILGHIFLDLYPREGKFDHAAHFSITCGRQPADDSMYQTPIVALVCNFGKDTRTGERLLTISEYETLFHEFGHSLHSLFSRTKYQHLSGTRVTTDFVEVPSHVLEHFAWDPRVISKFARHYKTGEPMPTRLLRSLCASRWGFVATDVQMQLLFSAMDLEFHGESPPIGCTTTAFEALQKRLTVYKPDTNVPVPASFHHFVGYGAGYYSYLFARIISAQLWDSLFESDPFSREGGRLFRHNLLALGGARDSSEILRGVIRGDIRCDAFLRKCHLTNADEKRSLHLPMTKQSSRQTGP